MAEELKPTDPQYWFNQVTPELSQRIQAIQQEIDAIIQAIKDARPIHPETGEEGTFHEFCGGCQIRAVYITPSGLKFFNPK